MGVVGCSSVVTLHGEVPSKDAQRREPPIMWLSSLGDFGKGGRVCGAYIVDIPI